MFVQLAFIHCYTVVYAVIWLWR